ncbi:MAG: class I adenylate-forming enzyme family protein [Candidatus Eremiobacteraeota bacterium]|nr:class I adenylate-forming enzyme family protein [Candidatus Eremiobacteraeota bacterium]
MNAIEWLLQIPQKNARRDFLIDTISQRMITFEEYHRAALAIAQDLKKRGLGRGDRVALLLNNSSALATIYLGCLYAGLVTVPINPIFNTKEIEFMVSYSKAKILVVSPETFQQVNKSKIIADGIKILALLDRKNLKELSIGIEVWDTEKLELEPDISPFEGVSSEDIMTIVFTSGTTAHPSAVVHKIADMIDNARLFNSAMKIGPDNRFYGILSMTYLGGYYNLLMLPYVGTSSVVLSHAFDARLALDFWGPAQRNHVNTLWLVPTILSILLRTDRGQEGERFCRENVRLSLVGTAPLPLKLRHDFEKKYGVTLYENYGLTETFFITTNIPYTPIIDGSAGKVLPGIELQIRDPQGNSLTQDLEGEIYVKTPYIMKEISNPDKDAPLGFSKIDWFATGDIGRLEDSACLYITGRLKDMIIRGGINISPSSIERILTSHPGVMECAVIGVPHDIYGEGIAAIIKIKPGIKFEDMKTELIKMCKEHLGATKQPSYILEIEEFPYNAAGKIQKSKLKAWTEARISRE